MSLLFLLGKKYERKKEKRDLRYILLEVNIEKNVIGEAILLTEGESIDALVANYVSYVQKNPEHSLVIREGKIWPVRSAVEVFPNCYWLFGVCNEEKIMFIKKAYNGLVNGKE